MSLRSVRRDYLTRPIHRWAKRALPKMSETERAAIEAGDVWWDAELFSGNPDWRVLMQAPPAKLSPEEQAFLEGPVRELCGMLDEWKISWEEGDLPPEVWRFMREKKFFGMIIPKKYGGLGFSAFAHSEVIRTLSSRSNTGAVTVMVPNSLGPGELLMQFGTDAQRDHWLPRLASGEEIPCFGLTSAQAGSDAAAMTDTGVVCRGKFDGKEVLGIRLNWRKRYITLCPVATVLGLAFKLYDPDGLLGEKEDIGITVALIPTGLPGVTTGRRHLPAFQFFQNGPTEGKDVFIPLDFIIGGEKQAGQGWRMLMAALAAGRGISLPSLSAAGAAMAARTTGAYARVRVQFGLPVGKFEGVQQMLGRIAATAYLLDAARHFTCAALDQGRKLAVSSAILKYHATDRMRAAIIDAMDVHGGKAIMDGPLNYLGNAYRAAPVGITVEGANALTRNLIIFGQGSIRCHPHLLSEMEALQIEDEAQSLDAFDRAFWKHVGHTFATAFRAKWRSWTGGIFAPAPDAGAVSRHYRQLSRYAAAFALTSDMALLTMGGALKRKENISARLGDILSELYLLSAVLKRWEEEGRQNDDLPLVDWCMADGIARINRAFDGVFANMPSRFAATLLWLMLPLGSRREPPDRLTQACAELISSPSTARERLTSGLYAGREGDGVWLLEDAFRKVIAVEDVLRRLKDRRVDLKAAKESGLVSDAEARLVEEADAAVAKVVEVDDFDARELSGLSKEKSRREFEPRRAAG
ncbi:MAG: acyl-CoA dehydrogenase [Xanthobacteraceae bacterium]|nr:acyl-CoA dehydrogenase [Xanthobacteraceae bacterium]MCW5673454.1 acyl-CoA dehydrogenase [Xanthobacteraceae bacterium]